MIPTSWCSCPYIIPSLECRWDMGLVSKQQNMARVIGCLWLHRCDCVAEDFNVLLGDSPSLLLALKKQAAILCAVIWTGPHSEEWRAASSQQPTKNWGPRSSNPQETKCCQQLCELGNNPSPVEPSDENCLLLSSSESPSLIIYCLNLNHPCFPSNPFPNLWGLVSSYDSLSFPTWVTVDKIC